MDQMRTTVTALDVATATSEVLEEFKARISRRTQLQIEDQTRVGNLAVLGALAGAAHSSGGWFTIDEVKGLNPDPSVISEASACADSLAERHLLIEAREDEFGRAFRFIEQTAPVYLWLLSAHDEHSVPWRSEAHVVTA
jgi:hypothetical protein